MKLKKITAFITLIATITPVNFVLAEKGELPDAYMDDIFRFDLNEEFLSEEVVEEENDEVEEKIGELVAKIYILKARYNDMIEKENYNVASDFYSLPKEEQTKERKYQMGLTFMNNLISLQKRCDGEMEVILSELTELLKNNDMSTELVDEIRKSYEEEKKSKKAYFVNKYTAKESRVNDEV